MASSKTAPIDHILHNFKAFQISMLCSPETTASSKTILSVAATLTASAVLFRNIANDLVPESVQGYFHSRLHKLVIDESDGPPRPLKKRHNSIPLCLSPSPQKSN